MSVPCPTPVYNPNSQVIVRQQKVIRRQQREIDSLKIVEKDSVTSTLLKDVASWEAGETGEKEKDAQDDSTTGDSAMDDETWEDDLEESSEKAAIETEVFSEVENSDSYITISDASFTDSEISKCTPVHTNAFDLPRLEKYSSEKLWQRDITEDNCFTANPYFDSENSSMEVTKNVEQTEKVDCVKMMIGDPEDLVDDVKESCLPDGHFPAINCLPRPVRMFRRSTGRHGGLGGLTRSKSENNLKELITKEAPKAPLFSSPFKNLWKKKEEDSQIMHISSPILNKRPMVLKSGEGSLGSGLFSSMTDLRSTSEPLGRPFFHRPIFSCFMGNVKERDGREGESWGAEGRSALPNHKTMTRPRDVKMRRQRRTQAVFGAGLDSYQQNYSIC